ncbi:Cu(I)-responsive transcriptional regulator [Ferrovibrio sp.]|uniref:Cu(I)-responsive transcriptional regulator n=1 Tax=Ferrovibrio sp. TaxID=1917215 RepID=UPI002619734D|nr:Cu(I)-responsive transcriptional regulator [Ferrovibrio sp.]
MNIGQASDASGVSAKMIRYYESVGLMPEAGRSASGYRVYGEADVHMLRFIRRSRDLGFALDDIRLLLGLWRDRSRPSAAVKDIAMKHIDDLTAKIAELQAMKRSLQHLAEACHGDARPDCPILDDLGGPGATEKACH